VERAEEIFEDYGTAFSKLDGNCKPISSRNPTNLK
jgi:hypothetical protein